MNNRQVAKAVMKRHKEMVKLPIQHALVEAEIEKIAKQFGLPAEEVRRVAIVPFALMRSYRDDMETRFDVKDGFPSVRVPYIGIFYPRPWKYNEYLERHGIISPE